MALVQLEDLLVRLDRLGPISRLSRRLRRSEQPVQLFLAGFRLSLRPLLGLLLLSLLPLDLGQGCPRLVQAGHRILVALAHLEDLLVRLDRLGPISGLSRRLRRGEQAVQLFLASFRLSLRPLLGLPLLGLLLLHEGQGLDQLRGCVLVAGVQIQHRPESGHRLGQAPGLQIS